MSLSDYLSADRIVLLVDATTRDTVFDAAARLLGNASPIATASVAEGLRQREQMGSTAIGHGVAIPHGRSNAFGSIRAAFMRVQPAVDFGAVDDEPVDLVFAVALPAHDTPEHLRLLSELAGRFGDVGFRSTLRAAGNVDALRIALLGPAGAAVERDAA